MRTVVRFYDRALDALSVFCAAIILAVMIGVTANVCSRYFLGRSLVWVFEVTEYALLYIPCLGMAWLARERGHVAIDTFVSMLPGFIRRKVFLVTTAACGASCGVIAFWGIIVVVDRYRLGTIIDQMVRTPEYLVLWVIPFGFGLATIEFTRLFLQQRSAGAAN